MAGNLQYSAPMPKRQVKRAKEVFEKQAAKQAIERFRRDVARYKNEPQFAIGDYAQIIEHHDLPKILHPFLGRIGKVTSFHQVNYPPRITILRRRNLPRTLVCLDIPRKGCAHQFICRTVPAVALEKLED